MLFLAVHFILNTTYVSLSNKPIHMTLLNQAHAGHRLVYAWFLRIAFVCECLCFMCACVSAPKAMNNQ